MKLSKMSIPSARSGALSLGLFSSVLLAQPAAPVDAAFVGKVSQGGMFEVKASQLAIDKASSQDVKDIAYSEVHDHQLVGDELKSFASAAKIEVASTLNPEFQQKFDSLNKLSGAAFDSAYVSQVVQIHDKDEKLFAQEAVNGSSPISRNSRPRPTALSSGIFARCTVKGTTRA